MQDRLQVRQTFASAKRTAPQNRATRNNLDELGLALTPLQNGATVTRRQPTMVDPIQDLVQRAASQEPHALQELLVAHLPMLQGWLRLRMGPALRHNESAIDLAQSVAREVLAELGAFQWRGEAAFRHWLFQRAQHKLLDRVRYVSAQRRDPARLSARTSSMLEACYATLATPSREVEMQEALHRIECAFDGLTEEQREAVSLFRICGLTHAEIAERMQKTEGAVRNLVYRGLSRLAMILANEDPDEARAPAGDKPK